MSTLTTNGSETGSETGSVTGSVIGEVALDTGISESIPEESSVPAADSRADERGTDADSPRPRAGGRHRHRRRRTGRRGGPLGLLAATARLPVRFARRLRPSRLPWYGALALGALIVAALVIDGLWWQSDRSSAANNTARGDALVAATSAAQKVLSFDYRTINADVARAKATATGPFLAQYDKTAASLAKEVGPAKAIVQATVQSGSIVNASNGQVTALLFVDQASVRQDAGSKTPVTRIDQARVQMTMVKKHGRWLVYSLASL